MSTEKEKWIEKISDLLRFIDLMVKQTCRRAYFEYQTRAKIIREDKNSIYSIDHLRKVYEKPREHIFQLLKNPQKTLKGVRVDNQGSFQKKDTKFTKIEQKMLLDFVKKIQDQAPSKQLVWLDLQHYLFYVYRNFACANPNPSPESLSAFFICEMKEYVDCLRKEDETQVWLRIFTLLREYCIFAQWHYSQNDEEHALMKFFYYYEAMLTAAKSLVPVFSDFEKDVIYKNYHVCWIDFNTFIFIRFFYESDRVNNRITECLRTRNSPGDSPQMFTLMNDLKKLWAKEQIRISLVNQDGKLPENSPEATREKKILLLHKKLLGANFWVDRSKEVKRSIDISRLDHNLFDLLKDLQFFPEGPGLNKNGQCICEECLIAKYKNFLDSNDDFSIIQTTDRTSFCRKCRCVLKLELFHHHVNGHSEDNKKSLSKASNFGPPEKMDSVIIKNNTSLSEMLNDKLKISENNVSNVEKLNKSNIAKFALEHYLQTRKDSDQQVKNKNGRSRIIRDDFLTNGLGKMLRADENEKQPPPLITAEKLGETELKIKEICKNGHKPCSSSRLAKYPLMEECSSKFCSTHYDDIDSCDSKKCDCTYCEVFGSVQKGVQLRDRLRVRLHQRRERRRENESKQGFINGDPNKVKASKVESRVPLPSSPSNIPSTPSDSSEYSITSRDMPDIRGLVNYIEGNTIENKVELAKKKAAKKARQKERREQERIQAELEAKRKLEEKTSKEKERKMELEKKEQEKRLEEAELKKRLKKKRQALKRQELERRKNTIVETIPAMVTIKRIANAENGSPSVTITLKGYTPDQDKLLTTLIDKSEEDKNEVAQLNDKILLQNKGGKKKKSGAKSDNSFITSDNLLEEPKIIAKNVKVTLAVDKNPIPIIPDPLNLIFDKQSKNQTVEDIKREREPTEEEIKALGNLRLPPGITITKVEGPMANKSCAGSETSKGTSVLGKSGVIVVDTEKLIQKKEVEITTHTKTGKRKKKKSKKVANIQLNLEQADKPKMITLRNPMFQHYQNQSQNKGFPGADESAPAAIFTRENGMVTIRSSRLQQSLNNGGIDNPSNVVPFGMSLMSNLFPEIPNLSPIHCIAEQHISEIKQDETVDKANVTTLNAQEILSGLPGIEITKVDKKSDTNHSLEINNSCRDAEISIIPSNGTDFDIDFDKDDDWLYDNVFKPRDVLEDDMDDEELELEAFKRFCQQSIPPKEKKVAHFNVADIVLKKKMT